MRTSFDEDTPRNYFFKALESGKLSTTTTSAFSPSSRVRCVAFRCQSAEDAELPFCYDSKLLEQLSSALNSRQGVVELSEVICDARTANAQNKFGETILMKAVRRSGDALADEVVKLLLCRGADPMVCCDSGKNVLHDLIWAGKPPPMFVLVQMEMIIFQLRQHTSKLGLVELLLSTDARGYTPVDYIEPRLQTNWRRMLDSIIGWALPDTPSPPPPARVASQDTPACAAPPRALAANHAVVETTDSVEFEAIVAGLDPPEIELLQKMREMRCSFLLASFDDPDAKIIAASEDFCTQTGYPMDEVLGRNCRFLQGPGTECDQVDRIRKALLEKSIALVNITNYMKDGAAFTNRFLLAPLKARGVVRYFAGIQNCPEVLVQRWHDHVAEQNGKSGAKRRLSVDRPAEKRARLVDEEASDRKNEAQPDDS